MEDYKTFSTTADVGIRIQGQGLTPFFKNALKGLNQLLFEGQPQLPHKFSCISYEYQGDSLENVLVNFLSEILYFLQTQGETTADICIKEVDEKYINAELLTFPGHHLPEMEIKSVTYHNLKIENNNGVYKTAVIFDI